MSCEYMQLTPVLFGAGAIHELGEQVAKRGLKNVMCVFDAGVKAAGIAAKATASLDKAGVKYILFDRVAADPPDALLDEAGAIGKEAGIDGVIGIGGGSSMDTAKAISILQKHPAPIVQYLNTQGPPFTVDGGVPVFLVPTSAGTGSEVTKMCIVSYTKINEKLPIYTNSTLAIVDPELCRTAPPSVTANGGLDALAHAMESITCVNHNPYSETLGLAAIRRIAKYLPLACQNGDDMEARSELSLAANWAGIAFSATDIHIGHAAGDSIAASYHTPHGLNCAWINAPVQELVAPAVPDKVKLIGEAFGLTFTGAETPEDIGKAVGAAVRRLARDCGVKSMKDMGFDRSVIVDKGAPYVAASALRFNCPVEITEEVAARLLASAYDDYQ